MCVCVCVYMWVNNVLFLTQDENVLLVQIVQLFSSDTEIQLNISKYAELKELRT